MYSKKVRVGEYVISTRGRNLIFSACYVYKIFPSGRHDKLRSLFTAAINLDTAFHIL